MEICGVNVDFSISNGFFINADCMQGMKDFPDNYFDLAVVDPPYGAGFTAPESKGGYYNRFGGRFDKYKPNSLHLRNQKVQQVTRTGGTWAEKYAKKSYRGIQPPEGNTLTNSFVSHVTRLSGGATTLVYRLHAAF